MEKPLYPDFKKITTEDISNITALLTIEAPYSDYNILSLLSWNASGDNSYATFKGNLVIRLKEYLGEGYMYLLYGTSHIDETIREILKISDKISMVPEETVKCIKDPSRYKIEEDRDNFDYVISLEEIANLSGGKFKSLRKHAARFRESHPGVETLILDQHDNNSINKVLDLTIEWGKAKGFDKDKIEEDVEITKNFIKFSEFFNCISLGIFEKDKLLGFTFNELLKGKWVMGHFGKADNNIEGSMIYCESSTAAYFLSEGYEYINHQQDAGLPKLREAKMGYKPIKFLKKYTISAL